MIIIFEDKYLNKKKALKGAVSGPCEILRSSIDTSTRQGSCSLIVEGEQVTSCMVTEPGLETTIDLVNDGGEAECELRLLLVGGGGYSDHGAGGGSGYLTYTAQPVPAG